MQYLWVEAKRQSNLKKHRLDFSDAQIVFDGLTLTFEDDRFIMTSSGLSQLDY
jgi:uncharacterized DUF497 family protein